MISSASVSRWATHPAVVLLSLLAGGALGLGAPALAAPLGIVGDVYVDLLKMVVLPFMASAITFSVQKLASVGGAAALARRTALVFTAMMAGVVAIGIAVTQPVLGRSEPSAQQMERYGKLVGPEAVGGAAAIDIDGAPEPERTGTAQALREALIPSNVFAALAQGESLKALVFAMLFGLALGSLDPARTARAGLAGGLETVYHACQQLNRWLSLPLPVALACMCASQLARTGLEPLLAMLGFLSLLGIGSAIALALSVKLLWWRSGRALREVMAALRAPFAMALATRNSAACMPAMIETLVERLGFARERVELVVPLAVSLLRLGPALYYACATLFIAHLYGRSLPAADLALVAAGSVLAAGASAGMTGLVTVSLTSLVCGHLGLPWEAALVLFLAVDPLADMLRTLVLVVGNTAAAALVCERPARDDTP